MTDPEESASLEATDVHVLVYSDDRGVRDRVRTAVGNSVGGRRIDWLETATHAAVVSAADRGGLDLLILDGEAAKAGGMGICRQLKHEIDDCPPVIVLVGRSDDAWLATWSEADDAVSHPIDPGEMRAAVAARLSADAAGVTTGAAGA
jgi:DNA-binding response OmpR family regulator